jgi:hypothetical protein
MDRRNAPSLKPPGTAHGALCGVTSGRASCSARMRRPALALSRCSASDPGKSPLLRGQDLPPFNDSDPNPDSSGFVASSAIFDASNLQVFAPRCGPRAAACATFASQAETRRKERMNRSVINLIAAAERSERGYADVPPGSVDDEIESELASFGYAGALSDRLWIGGYRVHTPESVLFGNYRPYVPRSIFTCASSLFAHVPDARDFNVEAVLEERGELRLN